MIGGAAMMLAVGFAWAMNRRWCELGGDPTEGWAIAVLLAAALAAVGAVLGAVADRMGGAW